MALDGDQSLESDMDEWKKETKFLFNFLVGEIDLLTHEMEIFKNEKDVKASLSDEKFESLEVRVERKIIKLEVDWMAISVEIASAGLLESARTLG